MRCQRKRDHQSEPEHDEPDLVEQADPDDESHPEPQSCVARSNNADQHVVRAEPKQQVEAVHRVKAIDDQPSDSNRCRQPGEDLCPPPATELGRGGTGQDDQR